LREIEGLQFVDFIKLLQKQPINIQGYSPDSNKCNLRYLKFISLITLETKLNTKFSRPVRIGFS